MNIYKSSRLFLAMSIFCSLFLIIYYIYISNYNKHVNRINEKKINFLLMQQSLPHYRAASKQILKAHLEMQKEDQILNSQIIPEKWDERVVKNRVIREKVQQMTANSTVLAKSQQIDVFIAQKDHLIYNRTISNIHIFYYTNIKWFKDNESKVFNVAFHPKIGFYNYSHEIVRHHVHNIRLCGVGVIIFNWHPMNQELNTHFDELFLKLVNDNYTNHNNTIKVGIQIDDYQDRTIESIRNNIKFIVDNFSGNPNFYKVFSMRKHRILPIFYVKNSFNIKELDWAKLLSKNGIITIRNTMYDAIILGHIEKEYHKSFIRKSQFDGFYTFNVSNGANYASTWKNWMSLKKFADLYNLIFVPSVGPGYYDTVTQPKYGTNRRFRSNGQYYEVGFRTALIAQTQLLSIESFNNWEFGTQIEAAIPATNFHDYRPDHPFKYLELTQYWVNQYLKQKQGFQSDKNAICNNLLNDTVC